MLTDPTDDPANMDPPDNTPPDENPPPDNEPPVDSAPPEEPAPTALHPLIVALGEDGQMKLFEITGRTRQTIGNTFQTDSANLLQAIYDAADGNVNVNSDGALGAMGGLAGSLEFFEDISLPSPFDFMDWTSLNPRGYPITRELPATPVLGTVVPAFGAQDPLLGETISAMTPFGPYSVNLATGLRSLQATYAIDGPLEGGVTRNHFNATIDWLDGPINSLTVDVTREFEAGSASHRLRYVYSENMFGEVVHTGSLNYKAGEIQGGSSFRASGPIITNSHTWIQADFENIKFGGRVVTNNGVAVMDAGVTSIYHGDGYLSEFILSLHKDPNLLAIDSGLMIHAGDDRYAGLTARVRNVTGQPEEFEYKGTFHVPLGMVNGVTTFGFGEIAVHQDGGSHSWGVLNIPQLKTRPELRTMIGMNPDEIFILFELGPY